MANVPVIVAFSKKFDKSSLPATPGDVQVQGNAILYIEEAIVSLFNIPVPAPDFVVSTSRTVAGFEYSRFDNFADSTGKTIIVPSYEAAAGGGKGVGKVIRIPHPDLKTKKGKARTMSIRFPGFFTILMLRQAIGTMLVAKQPSSWKVDGGRSYPFVKATAGIPAGSSYGAWVVTTPIAVVGADNTDKVSGTVITKGKVAGQSSSA